MAARKSGLGSGLSSLFADNALDISSVSNGDISVLRITHIEPKKNQPRKDFRKEALSELADSIAKHGIIQPIVVRSLPNGYYQIIAGERRWRAAKMAGLSEVPVVIKNVDELAAAEMTMIENLQREDLNPIEEAMGYKNLVEHYNLTQEEISRQVAKSRAVVANALRLLSLPGDVLKYIEAGEISAGHARALLVIDNPEEQIQLAERIIKNNLSVREVEKIVRSIKEDREKVLSALVDENSKTAKSENEKDNSADLNKTAKIEEVYLKNLQNKISDAFGRKVVINLAKKNKSQSSGKLEIEYKNTDELESIIKFLCGGDNIFEG